MKLRAATQGSNFSTHDRLGRRYLTSYSTTAASIDSDGVLHRHWDGYSATTLRHLNCWLMAVAPHMKKMTKAAWQAMPIDPPDNDEPQGD